MLKESVTMCDDFSMGESMPPSSLLNPPHIRIKEYEFFKYGIQILDSEQR